MANVDPTIVFAGYQVLAADAVAPEPGVFIPLSALPQLTEAEATTDVRQVAAALTEVLGNWYEGLAANDRPKNLTIAFGTMQAVAQEPNQYKRGITITPTYEHGTQANVAAEPT